MNAFRGETAVKSGRLREARRDAENAQDQLSKRVVAIRNELETRHGKEVASLMQRNSEQHSAQVSVLGTLRSELLKKEGEIQEARLRLQLFGAGGGGEGGASQAAALAGFSSSNDLFEMSSHVPSVQVNALQQERDFLLQKSDKLVEELKVCSEEKFELEKECERLISSSASLQADANHAHQELSLHRQALRALDEAARRVDKAGRVAVAHVQRAEDIDNVFARKARDGGGEQCRIGGLVFRRCSGGRRRGAGGGQGCGRGASRRRAGGGGGRRRRRRRLPREHRGDARGDEGGDGEARGEASCEQQLRALGLH